MRTKKVKVVAVVALDLLGTKNGMSLFYHRPQLGNIKELI